jgi:hypothetical protein
MATHAAPAPICDCPAPPPRVLLPAPQEASRFQQIMGLQQSLGFQLLMLSGVLVGLMCILHVVIFSLNNLATFVMVPVFALTVVVVVFFSFMPAIDALYRIKFAVHTNRPTTLSVEQLAPYVSSFCNEFGVGMLTESSLVDYIAGTRDNDPNARRDSFQSREGLSSVLSPATTTLLRAIVHDLQKRYVDDQMAKKGNRVVNDIAAQHGFK